MRIRIVFTKLGSAKYTGHLDLHKTWERTLRRARVPLAYSQGFNPQPRINLAAALPLGFTSECEVMDIWVEGEPDLTAMAKELERAAAPGVGAVSLRAVDDRLPALQTQVRSAIYRVAAESSLTPAEMDARLADLLAAEALPRERRGKPYDLRPLIEELRREDSRNGAHVLHMRLAAREGATGRPEEVVAALGLEPAVAAVHRVQLLFEGE